MQELTGTIQFKTFAEGTKSESSRPFLCLENGSQILLYKKNDNPFENNAFNGFDGANVTVKGEFINGVIEVEGINCPATSTLEGGE